MMTQARQAGPPSWSKPPLFMIGQNHNGNWVVQDQAKIRGGLFVDRDAALRYVRSENANAPQAIVMVSDVLELDMSRAARRPLQQDLAAAPAARRRVA